VSAAPPDPARALRELLPRYAARWARLAAAHPTPSPDPPPPAVDADAVDAVDAVAVDGDAIDSADSVEPAPEAQPRRLAYVDAFARSGLHAVERGPGGVLTAPGGERSAAIARAVLAVRGVGDARLSAAAVLVDEAPRHLAAIADELARHGIDTHSPAPLPPDALGDGDVALVEAAFASVAGALGMLADSPDYALLLLAPPTARALPWPALLSAVMGENADVLLVVPHAELHRQADFGAAPLVDMAPQQRRMVEGFSAMLGDARHGWLADWRRIERDAGRSAAESAFVAALAGRIREMADDGVVKALRIAPDEAGDPSRTLHLIHVTPHPSHALAMNEALREIGAVDRTPGAEAHRAPRLQPSAGESTVLELFGAAETHAGAGAPAAPGEPPVDVAALGERIAAEFRGRTVLWRDVLVHLAPGDATLDEAARAMAALKRAGRAAYRTLADERAEVEFPASPRKRAAGPRTPRKRRDAGAGLFAAPDDESPEP
jgi:hypothetical protein